MRSPAYLIVAALAALGCGKGKSEGPAPQPAPQPAAQRNTGPAPTVAAPAPTVPATPTTPTTPPAPTTAPGALLGSCAIANIACSDYRGAGDATPVKNACQGVGTWSDGPCRAGAVGTCTTTEAGGIVNQAHTYAPGTPSSAKRACDNTPGGVYSDG